jgi:hypothetical protein
MHNSSTTYPLYSTPYQTSYPASSKNASETCTTIVTTLTGFPNVIPTSMIITETAITVSTLFNYDFLTPPVFQETPTASM